MENKSGTIGGRADHIRIAIKPISILLYCPHEQKIGSIVDNFCGYVKTIAYPFLVRSQAIEGPISGRFYKGKMVVIPCYDLEYIVRFKSISYF